MINEYNIVSIYLDMRYARLECLVFKAVAEIFFMCNDRDELG